MDFVRAGLEQGEPVLVAVPQPGLGLVRSALRPDEVDRVRTADMGQAGRNPGRITGSVLTAFVAEHAGRPVRIIGEPIWAGRSADEYPACAEHEALINVALAGTDAYVLCPYDVTRLARAVLVDATRTDPTLAADGERWHSPAYADPIGAAAWFDRPLPPAPPEADVLVIGPSTGPGVARRFVHTYAERKGMRPERAGDLRTAAQEHEVVFQVQDGGRITDPLIGRRPQAPTRSGTGCTRCTGSAISYASTGAATAPPCASTSD